MPSNDPVAERPEVLHLSTSDLGHGAGIAAFRLHQGLRSIGIRSWMLVNEKLSNDVHVHLSKPKPKNQWGLFWRDSKHMVETGLNFSAFQNLYAADGRAIRNHRLFREAEIIHLQNIHSHVRNIFSVCLFQALKNRTVVWTLHDMWPLSGHCFYSFGCERWLTGCGHCPSKNVYIRLLMDSTAQLFWLKQRMYRRLRLTVVAPSRWLAGIASQSPLFASCTVRCIPYGIDTESFQPTNPSEARHVLGLPADDRPLVLFIAHNLSDYRKGFHLFTEAVSILREKGMDCHPILIGSGQHFSPLKEDPRTIDLGPVTEHSRLALAYSAADLMVIPSLQDNLPNTVMESLACGTPVLCYRTGGLPDMVGHMETGLIVEQKDSAALAAGLATLLQSPELLARMRPACRQTILARFTLEHQAADYAALYQEITH